MFICSWDEGMNSFVRFLLDFLCLLKINDHRIKGTLRGVTHNILFFKVCVYMYVFDINKS